MSVPKKGKRSKVEVETKPQTIEERYAFLNQPRDPKKEISAPLIPCCPITFPNRTISAPNVLVQDKPIETVKKLEAFVPEIPCIKPTIYLEPVLTWCERKKLHKATSNGQVRELIAEFLNAELHEQDIRAKNIFLDYLTSAFLLCKTEEFSEKCTDTMFNLFYYTHKYFLSSLWRSADEVYNYMKELILLHSVMNPPESTKIFSPFQAQKGLIEFCKIYLRHLPLIRALCLPNYRMKISWTQQEEKRPSAASKTKI